MKVNLHEYDDWSQTNLSLEAFWIFCQGQVLGTNSRKFETSKFSIGLKIKDYELGKYCKGPRLFDSVQALTSTDMNVRTKLAR